MKRILIGVVCLLITSGLYAQSEKELRAAISHVTVYPDRAQVSHSGKTDIPAGKTVIKLSGLSPYIDSQSIQVKGTGNFTILSVNHRNNYLQNLQNTPDAGAILKQIEELKEKVEDEKAAINVLKEKEAFLIANRAVLVKETTFSVEQFKSLMDIYTSNMELVSTSVLKKGRLIHDYEEQIANLQNQINTRVNPQQLPTGEIAVIVSAENQVSGIINIDYVVSNAGWYPSYDIKVDDITKPVTIVYKANLQQNTGTAWKDVKLSFSNATPWVSGNVPILYPWMVDFYVPRAPMPLTRKMSDLNSASAPPQARSEEIVSEVAEAKMAAVERRTGQTSITFDAIMPYTVPSNGSYQTIEIQKTTALAEYKYVTVPRISNNAYLTANITGWAEQVFQSGEANLYFENSYVGKSSINTEQATDTFAISLGTDNSIVVKREKRKDFTSRKTIGSNRTDFFSYLITVRNNKKTPVKITVNDQVPLSSNSSIEVNVQELSGGKLSASTGFVKWDLEMKPNESKELILTYSVKYPKNKTVIVD
jgi:uncharacterized protein (TIGR02231 family)